MKLFCPSFAVCIAAMMMLPASRAFTFNALNVPSPVLDRFAQDVAIKKPTEMGTLLDVSLDVGKNGHHMNLNGMLLELLPDNISKKEAKMFPGLPGANGPNPKSSTGAKHLNIQQKPSFIDMTGKQSVLLENGCWEVVWRDGASAGSLICGFESPNTYQRNDATLPKGRLYFSFPVYTKETLTEAQQIKADGEKRAKKFLDEKMDALNKYVAEPHIIKKVMYYREALAAAEKLSLVPTYKDVPLDRDTMVLQDDLILTTKGSVWTKQNGGGIFSGPNHTKLGTATVSPVVEKVDVDIKGQLRP